VYLLARLIASDPGLWPAVEARMNELLPLALGIVYESLSPYPEPPFGLAPQVFVEYATDQFATRFARLERARTQTLAELEAWAETDNAEQRARRAHPHTPHPPKGGRKGIVRRRCAGRAPISSRFGTQVDSSG
jgi:hypothetical protein